MKITEAERFAQRFFTTPFNKHYPTTVVRGKLLDCDNCGIVEGVLNML